MASLKDIIKTYPNVIAVQQVDMKTHLINNVTMMKDVKKEIEYNKMANKKQRRGKKKIEDSQSSTIVDIWKNIGTGRIDLNYAVVGRSLDGQMIIDYDIFINLLMTYGYMIDDIMQFIDDFADKSTDVKNSPIIMINSHTARIMADVPNIVDQEK